MNQSVLKVVNNMKYVEVGYTCSELVQYRNDFKAIKIGDERVTLCEDYSNQLKDALQQDKLSMCIHLFNQTMFDLS